MASCNCPSSSSEDIDLHRYRCTECGKVGYYSSSARDHFVDGKKDSFITETNQRYMERQGSNASKYRNNPQREPQGHYTGRCGACGSKNLWDDNTAYGCNDCGGFWC